MNNTEKRGTKWGEITLYNRKGYWYAIRTVNKRKRSIYLGKIIPEEERLSQVGQELYLSADEWERRHGRGYQDPRTLRGVEGGLTMVEKLKCIQSLAKARKETWIAIRLEEVIKELKGLF